MRGDNRAAIGLDALQRVPPDRVRKVGRVEIDHIVRAIRRRRVGDRRGLVAMRIDKRKAAVAREIGAHQILQQRRFAGAGLADDLDMAPALVRREQDQFATVGAKSERIVRIHRPLSEPCREWSTRATVPVGGGKRPVCTMRARKNRPCALYGVNCNR